MREVSLLPSICRIFRRPPASSLAFGCPPLKLIVDRCVRASNPCGYGAKRESFAVKCLYLPPFIKGKVLSQFTNDLRCGRMGVVHSDCSFADVCSRTIIAREVTMDFVLFVVQLHFITNRIKRMVTILLRR